MLSRVLTETEAEVAPPRWLSQVPGGAVPAARPRHSSESETEARNAAVEQRVRQAYESGFREGEAAAAKAPKARCAKPSKSWPPPWLKWPPRAATPYAGPKPIRAAFH